MTTPPAQRPAPNPWMLVSVNAEAPYGDHVVHVAVHQILGCAHFATILGGTERYVAGICRDRGPVKSLTRARARDQYKRISGAVESAGADDSARRLDALVPFWFRFDRQGRTGAISPEQVEWLVMRSAREAARLLRGCHLAK